MSKITEVTVTLTELHNAGDELTIEYRYDKPLEGLIPIVKNKLFIRDNIIIYNAHGKVLPLNLPVRGNYAFKYKVVHSLA